jgi:hypothetical protein
MNPVRCRTAAGVPGGTPTGRTINSAEIPELSCVGADPSEHDVLALLR